MIRKSGYRFSLATNAKRLRGDHAQIQEKARHMGADSDRNFIERLTWDEVARRIAEGAAAVLPIGAAAKQHGFHLPLNTDLIQAEWFAAKLAERIGALIWP